MKVRVWLAILAIAAVAIPVSAQVQTGSILVRATDSQGGAVPGVTITLTSPVLVSGSTTAITDSAGVNRFPSLQPGLYSVKLELQGFRTVVREGVQVVVGQTVPLDMQLSVATVAETVTVTGSSNTPSSCSKVRTASLPAIDWVTRSRGRRDPRIHWSKNRPRGRPDADSKAAWTPAVPVLANRWDW